MKKIFCIYHAKCADGFTAAWVVHEALGPAVEFHEGVHNEAPPDVTGKHVVLVDFSYKRDVMLDIAAKAKTVLVLDHHKSAQENLQNLPPNVTLVFNMNKSGAMLTWDWYFADHPPPRLLEYVQDRDLWRFELPNSREVNAALFSYEYDFAVWSELMSRPIIELVEEGEAIERKHWKDIRELIAVAATRSNIGGYDVPTLNCPYFFSSDAAHVLAEGEPFAACYYDTADYRVYSLRSAEDGMDVSKVAEQFNGGGHRHAAGFRLPLR